MHARVALGRAVVAGERVGVAQEERVPLGDRAAQVEVAAELGRDLEPVSSNRLNAVDTRP